VKRGILDAATAQRELKLIERIGFETFHPGLLAEGKSGEPVILEGLEEFREHLGGELTVTLVPKIGQKLEVHEMDRSLILAAVEELRARELVGA
jgi:3-dehydroquinate synthase